MKTQNFLIRDIPKGLHREIKNDAKKQKKTMSAVILQAVNSYYLQKSLRKEA